MKTVLQKFSTLALSILPALAMLLAVSSVGATCYAAAYQPDVPESLAKFQH
jgi:cyclic lactone autoinducer peptide